MKIYSNNEEKLIKLLQNINDIYITLDEYFKVRYCSPSIQKISRLNKDEIARNQLDKVLTFCHVNKLKRGMKKMQTGQSNHYIEVFSVKEESGMNSMYRLKLKRPLYEFGFESAVIAIVQKIQ